jgi:hypothetical protein
MQLTQFSDYALRILVYLAAHNPKQESDCLRWQTSVRPTESRRWRKTTLHRKVAQKLRDAGGYNIDCARVRPRSVDVLPGLAGRRAAGAATPAS